MQPARDPMVYGRERWIKYHRDPAGRERLLRPWGALLHPLVLKAASRLDGRIEVRAGRPHERQLANVLGTSPGDARFVVQGYRDLRDLGLVAEEPGAIVVPGWGAHRPRRGPPDNDAPAWCCLLVRESETFARLPAVVRGFAHLLLRVADDDGGLPGDDVEMLKALRWLHDRHFRRTRIVDRWIAELMVDGYLIRDGRRLMIRNYERTQNRLAPGRVPPRLQIVVNTPESFERPPVEVVDLTAPATSAITVPAAAKLVRRRTEVAEPAGLRYSWPPPGWPAPTSMSGGDMDREWFHESVKPAESLEVAMRDSGHHQGQLDLAMGARGGARVARVGFQEEVKPAESFGAPLGDRDPDPDIRSQTPLSPPADGGAGKVSPLALSPPDPDRRRPRNPRLPRRPPAVYPEPFERCWEQALRRQGSRGNKFAAYRAFVEVADGNPEALATRVLEALGWQRQLTKYRRPDAMPPDFATWLRGRAGAISLYDRREDQGPEAFADPPAGPAAPKERPPWAVEKDARAERAAARAAAARDADLDRAGKQAQLAAEMARLRDAPAKAPPLPAAARSEATEGPASTTPEIAPENAAPGTIADPAIPADRADSAADGLVAAPAGRAPPLPAPRARVAAPIGGRRE